MRPFLSCAAALLMLSIPSAAHTDEPAPMPSATERVFAPGPALTDNNSLLAWFKAHPEAYVQLPVAIEFTTEGPREILRAWISPSTDDPPHDAIFLSLDDRLFMWMDVDEGIIALNQMDYRLHNLCVERVRCVLRIGGHWGQAIRPLITQWPPPPAPPDMPPYPFTVRELDPLEGAPAWLMVEQ